MIYFNSQKIPELAGLTFAQRMQLTRAAADRLTTPVKVMLNIIKLCILTPLFILIARANGWEILGYIVLLLVLYPLVTRPITFHLCRSQFVALRRKYFPEEKQQVLE